ncbi:hypothetical protein ACFL1K_00525 [Candidatus Omnitrophota bacterium]
MRLRGCKAKSFVVIMISIAVMALLLRFAVKKAIEVIAAQNQANASRTLKLISAALENYAKDAKEFPQNFNLLVESEPAYLDRDYISESPRRGYIFDCARFEPSGYSCSAAPTKCGRTGSMSYAISTGGVFVSEKCSSDEE